MFNSNSNSNKGKQEQDNKKISANASPSSIGHGTIVTGTIDCNSDIRVDGQVKGNVKCTGKLIVGPKGIVDGEVICDNAIIQGKIIGRISVKESLEVQESAEIKGEIFTKKLQVQSGAIFNVTCDMSGKQIKSFTRDKDAKGEVVSLVN